MTTSKFPLRGITTTGNDAVSLDTFLAPDGHVVPVTTTTQKIFRDGFAGTTMDASLWEVQQVGTGMSLAVSDGLCAITMGVTQDDAITLLSRDTFHAPFRVMVGSKVSQRIAGNSITIGVVSVDANGVPDGRNVAEWVLTGTTVTQGTYRVAEDGASAVLSAAVTTLTTAANAILEVECFPDEVYFHSRAIDSVAARVNSYVSQSRIPDPNSTYRLRITASNPGAVPASSTVLSLVSVSVHDYQELTAEISGGRGNLAAGQGLGVYSTGGAGGSSAMPVQGASARNSAGIVPIPLAFGYSALPAAVGTGRVVDLLATLQGAIVTRPYSIPEADWQYAPAAAITATTDVVAKAAGGATIRNYVTAVQLANNSATATEVVIKDGSTVLWRCNLPANAPLVSIAFPTSLRGSLNTALNVACVTTGAAVYANLQGYQAV